MTQPEVILSVQSSPMRRTMGVGSLGGLGVLMLWISFAGTAPFSLLVPLLVGALLAIWGAIRLYQVTSLALELTRDGIRTADGMLLVGVDDIARIERGAFALKPSNGFLVRLKSPATRSWAPGIWWRWGTFLGIGGVLPPGETRAMADLLRGVVDGTLPDRQ